MTPPDLSHTPGVYYAVAYWLSCTFYILQLPRRLSPLLIAAVQGSFLALLGTFMFFTDGLPVPWFLPCMSAIILLILLDIKLCCSLNWLQCGYACIRAFILGEFAAALEWQLFYFGLTALGLPLQMWVNLLFLLLAHAIVFGGIYLLERNLHCAYPADLTPREFASTVVICLAVFAASNLSYISSNTPFSSRFTAEIFIIRTLVDLGGVVILHAYHVRLQKMSAELEMAHLQNVLHMQYENYRISEQSIDLVNQKYHDLKHYIQLLRSEVSAEEKLAYLDQVEQEIQTYEAQNKTGNRVLDAILTAKSLQCQREGVTLTCVADGEALSFMHPVDISALFGNALDNALEGVKKLEDPEKRLIHLSMARQKNFLRIRVENCFEGELRLEKGLPASTKGDDRFHGFGLKSIQNIAAKYGGSAAVAVKDGWFELRVLFPLAPENNKEASHGDHKQN